jgi:Ni/Fe-hydrogenase 1 B-type cytochrome subunit
MARPERRYVWSVTVRVIHWLTFLSVLVLLVTGNYIAHTPAFISPTGEPYQNFFMANMRFVHFISAIVFDVGIVVSIYLIFFSTFHAPWRELTPTTQNLNKFWKMLKYYFRLSGEKVKYDVIDPVDLVSFLSFHILAILLIFTGFALYVAPFSLDWWWPQLLHLTTDWVVWLFRGLNGTRIAHHLMWWLILAWVLVHVYFQVWKTIKLKTGEMGSIFSGYRYPQSGK